MTYPYGPHAWQLGQGSFMVAGMFPNGWGYAAQCEDGRWSEIGQSDGIKRAMSSKKLPSSKQERELFDQAKAQLWPAP